MKELEAIRDFVRDCREKETMWLARAKDEDYSGGDSTHMRAKASIFGQQADKIESLLPALEAEIAALREPMSCGHPRACWQATKPDSVDAVVGYRCIDCEHERLAVAAAIDKTEELFVKILRGELPAMAANNCDAVALAVDAHDADTRNRALEEAATTAKQYGLGHEGDSIAAAIRSLKREKRGDLLNDEQLAGINPYAPGYQDSQQPVRDVINLLETIADLKRQLAERDRIAYPIIGIPSAKDFARQCDPFEPDSETTTGTCAHWRDKVEKVFAHVRSIFDAYVQEKVDRAVLAESEWWHPHAPMHHLDYMKEFGKECPCIKCRRLAANRAKVKT